MSAKRTTTLPVALFMSLGLLVSMGGVVRGGADQTPEPLAPLPGLTSQPDPGQVELGKLLFFDVRFSGDGSTSCSSCHQPDKGWSDGLPMSIGYPGSLYFRNTPTVINAVHGRYMFWDGRLPASDLPTLVRDHISEAHFMQADGRLIIERARQIPVYEEGFKKVFGGEPTYGRILNAITAYLRTLRSRNAPIDRYLRGDTSALSPAAKRGLDLFRGKAGCIQCHDGAMFSDGDFHATGAPTNPDIFATPERHISFRRFFKMLGVSEYVALREDVGLYAVTKQSSDRGKFRTPTLREVSRTAPYMHDGSFATLEGVVDFYDAGGGEAANPPNKDLLLRPLGLDDQEKKDLVEFLKSLSGAPIQAGEVELPPYELRKVGENR